MKFSVREDVDAPIADVFAMATDFDRFERQAMRRGIEVRRTDAAGMPGLGSEWLLLAKFRGKDRKIKARIEEFDRPNGLRILSGSGGIDGAIDAEFLPLSPRRTRVSFAVDLTASTLSGRLLLQSLKFARGTIQRRLEARIASFKQAAEDRHGPGTA
ncbi:SRPBCC family protein [Anianabacter salinae]|uniref:SRPBCC family protein n=1 Tax=Anianabacter salinae TaxID=2851023 RepID=UPI00225DF56B|nr:SRPBCC family protein [Anianabacter salinae]MBV0913217.1 SRPBCC family protein [Anianabacter salinae]